MLCILFEVREFSSIFPCQTRVLSRTCVPNDKQALVAIFFPDDVQTLYTLQVNLHTHDEGNHSRLQIKKKTSSSSAFLLQSIICVRRRYQPGHLTRFTRTILRGLMTLSRPPPVYRLLYTFFFPFLQQQQQHSWIYGKSRGEREIA